MEYCNNNIFLFTYIDIFVTALPLIAQRPADTHVSSGSNAIFECGVKGNPKPTIFWSLQNNDTVLFPNESWNEFHAEDTKDSVSTLVVHVSRVIYFGAFAYIMLSSRCYNYSRAFFPHLYVLVCSNL